jgi:hypothetical protein
MGTSSSASPVSREPNSAARDCLLLDGMPGEYAVETAVGFIKISPAARSLKAIR